ARARDRGAPHGGGIHLRARAGAPHRPHLLVYAELPRAPPRARRARGLARISHRSPTASAKGAPSRGVLGPRSSTYCRVRLRRSVLRAPRSDAPLTLSRRRPVRIAASPTSPTNTRR